MTDAAFTADFADMKIIKTRKCVQWVYETPIEDMQKGLDAMGGPPHPGHSVHVAIARLVVKPAPDKPKRERLTSERAAMLCNDHAFQHWIAGADEGEATVLLRRQLGIQSRRELDTDPEARARFEALETEFLQATGRMASDR